MEGIVSFFLMAYVTLARGEARIFQFNTLPEDQTCCTTKLSNNFTAPSVLSCHTKCLSQFPDTCHSVLYDNQTQICTPAGSIFRGAGSPSPPTIAVTGGTEVLWARLINSTCDMGFELYRVDCGLYVCLHLSLNASDFLTARSHCESFNSTLYIANTEPKIDLFWVLASVEPKEDTWVGLSHLLNQGGNTFVWENGLVYDSALDLYNFWKPNQPTFGPSEPSTGSKHPYCAMAVGTSSVIGFNDLPCFKLAKFICEKSV